MKAWIKRLFSLPLLLAALERQSLLLFGWLLLATPVPVQAQFNYTVTNGTITITRSPGTDEVVVIPNAIDGLPVTSIGSYSFRDALISACEKTRVFH
jgi:hypothetical protein